MNIEQALAEREAVKRCGTQTTWPTQEPRPYLIDYSGNPIPQGVIRALWHDLETVK